MSTYCECLNCRYFQDGRGDQPAAESLHRENGQCFNGTCHCHCPVPVDPGQNDSVVNYAYWPAVLSDDWCGEFQPKSDPAERSGAGRDAAEKGAEGAAGRFIATAESDAMVRVKVGWHGTGPDSLRSTRRGAGGTVPG